MDAQRWRRISALFDEIVELPEQARSEALDRACDKDPTLREELAALLRHDAASERDLSTLLHAPGHVAVEWAEFEHPGIDTASAGRSIGRWRVLSELGRGGMGVVYLAERADGQFEQRAALKLIRTDDDSLGLRRRFLRERQILADLEHPNIARLLDGGIAEDGRPYFAMEYVDGRPVLEYVSEWNCDARARLKLFLEICDAVQFAHRRLIVHRDIKPSNVLVAADGTIKLLDFGVATLLNPGTADDTQTRMQAFTPAYAAPEQLRGGLVTTAADIYALGVLLYELLSGARPYRLDEGATPVEWARLIDGPLCSAPSVAAGAARDSTRRPRVPPLPARTLRGDLDLIVLTALRREPERRYASVDALAADVQHYLNDRPITARADSARYVIGKFIGRHRIGTAAATIATLVLFAALGAALLQAHRAREQAQRARTAAAIAQQQTRRAEAVRQFLVGVFEQTEPDANQGRPLTAHELLEKGEQQLGRGPHDRALDADASALLADLYEQIGDFDRAQQLLKRALAASEEAAIPDDIKARVLIGVAGVEDDNDDYDIAIAHARQGMQLLQDTMPAAAELTAKAHNIIAHCLIGKGDGAAAETLLREALAHDVAALGDRNESVAEEWVELGTVLGNAGRYGEAETAFQRGIESWRAMFGENSFHVAHALNELSNMLSDKNDFAGAERALRQSLAIRTATVGPRHRDTLIVEHNLLVTLELEGRIAESLPKRLELIQRASASTQMHPRDLGSYYNAAGSDLRDLGRISEAEAMFAKAIAAYDAALGKDSSQSVSARRGLGTSLTLQGRYAEAEATLRNAIAILLRHHDADNAPAVATARADLGHVLRLEHRGPEALTELRAAGAVFERAHSTDRSRFLAASELAEAEIDAGDAEAAQARAESALAGARNVLPAGHYLLAVPLFALARAELAARRYSAAEALLREALALRTPIEPPADPRVLEVKVALVDALEGQGRRDDARPLRRDLDAPLNALHTPYAGDLRDRLSIAAPSGSAGRALLH
jgi:serine/threonine-protein kinase